VHFHGIPTPKIVWYKDSFEIFSSRRMRVTVENDVSSLVIHQTAFTDEGEYKCTATNRAGHIITKAKLRLEGTKVLIYDLSLFDFTGNLEAFDY